MLICTVNLLVIFQPAKNLQEFLTSVPRIQKAHEKIKAYIQYTAVGKFVMHCAKPKVICSRGMFKS